jgi:hypothetical protein
MARPIKIHEDKKGVFGALLQNKVIDLIGRKRCKEIAENAVNKEYKRLIKGNEIHQATSRKAKKQRNERIYKI